MIYSAEGSEIEFPANDRCLFRLLVVLYQAVADGACRRWCMQVHTSRSCVCGGNEK